MLNLVAFDTEYDSEILNKSYKTIKNRNNLEIVVDEDERKMVYNKTISAMSVSTDVAFTFQNLFKLKLSNGSFYIAQCLFDFGYPVSRRLSQSSVHRYHFQIIGIANLKIDLGKTLLREETKMDKVVGRFFGNDIDLNGTEKFNDKYYLVSDKKDTVIENFDKTFVNSIAKYNNIVLVTKGNDMFISFQNEIEENQSRIVEDVLSNCKFLNNN